MAKDQQGVKRTSIADRFNVFIFLAAMGGILRYLYRYQFGTQNLNPVNNIILFIIAFITYYIANLFNLMSTHYLTLLGICGIAYILHLIYNGIQLRQGKAYPRYNGTSVFSVIPVMGNSNTLIAFVIEPSIILLIGYGAKTYLDPTIKGIELLAFSVFLMSAIEYFLGMNKEASIQETLELARSSMQTNQIPKKQFIIDNTPEAIKKERQRIFAKQQD